MPDWPELRGLPMQDCRRCTAPIRFVALTNGSALPVNPLPDPKGNVCARKVAGRLRGYVISREHAADPLFLRFMPHHATCQENLRATRPEDPALF